MNLQLPLVQRHVGFHTEIEHGEIVDLTLPRRETMLGADGGLFLAGHLASPAFFGRDVGVFHVGQG